MKRFLIRTQCLVHVIAPAVSANATTATESKVPPQLHGNAMHERKIYNKNHYITHGHDDCCQLNGRGGHRISIELGRRQMVNTS